MPSTIFRRTSVSRELTRLWDDLPLDEAAFGEMARSAQ